MSFFYSFSVIYHFVCLSVCQSEQLLKMANYLWKEYDLEVDDKSLIKLATFSLFLRALQMNENSFRVSKKDMPDVPLLISNLSIRFTFHPHLAASKVFCVIRCFAKLNALLYYLTFCLATCTRCLV